MDKRFEFKNAERSVFMTDVSKFDSEMRDIYYSGVGRF